MSEIFHSVRAHTTATLKVEGSRFIADVIPAEQEDEARAALEAVRKKYFDATHHCFAYSIGAEKKLVRFSDDGEPSGTAGVKIHSAIQSKDLSDIAVVVTRYFGGTKLGVGGLGRAYFESAENGIALATIIRKATVQELHVTFPFSETNPVMNIINSQKLAIASTGYSQDRTRITLHILPSVLDPLSTHITNATRGTAQLERGEWKTVLWK